MDEVKQYIEYVARGLEAIGVVIIALGALIALFRFLIAQLKFKNHLYTRLRRELGKAILLGLEVLVAADIIATVVTEPTLGKVFTLGVIVLIRTFLSISLQVEIEGKFPWQSKKDAADPYTD
ncbi:putative membrane protein [Gillisia sp. Hel_I_86]|uniref:DUF1622 domain-containing protein n=1 Tax=Gillisia sp. Hel_I_86 TaxID=1249981 RepID=UPI00119A20A4|nr:DUF1622 domain-containing protein [Gillisia sp. Hel_I_86]TVZ28382.1 putative membrane protein [Gillisia sp. Hel_I_86]